MDWRPNASTEILQLRARMLQQLRAFFAARQVLEVETPLLSRAAVTDQHIESFKLTSQQQDYYLHTSPEFAMKRLLAAGNGSIYQVCKVFRQGEAGRKHNPEFSMLEWYRVGFDQHALMNELDELVRALLAESPLGVTVKLTYRNALQRFADIDPFTASAAELKQCAAQHGVSDVSGMELADKDSWLDLLMTHVVEPALPANAPVFVYDYPASQASLAKIRNNEQPVAERFELYINSMELANGFHELTDATQQRQRFEHDLQLRQQNQLPAVPIDEKFLAALSHGLPECAGVAVGLDRLVMLAAGVHDIREVLSFDFDRA